MQNLTIFTFFVLVSIAFARIVPAPQVNHMAKVVKPNNDVQLNCDYHCTRVDIPVCAHNGQCMQKFQTKCEMAAYNCANPQKPFKVVEDWRCEQSWAPLCEQKELGPQ